MNDLKAMHDKFKSDVFGLGMTLLESATLKNSLELYDFNNYRIKYEEVELRLLLLRSMYSGFLTNFIKECLQIEENLRPNFNELYQVLEEYG